MAIFQGLLALITRSLGSILSALFGWAVVALFGPTVEAFGFFPYTARASVLELALSCRPCSSKGGPRCPLGHHRCLIDIDPESVYGRVRRFLT